MLQWLQGTSIIIGLIAAIAIVVWHNHRSAEAKHYLWEHVEHEMTRSGENINRYFDNIYTMLRFMSLEDEVKEMTTNSYDELERIYKDQYQKHYLSELYVIQRDFDGTRKPIMTFEYEEGDPEVETEHDPTDEQYEYQAHMAQIQQFIQDPAIRFQITFVSQLCVDKPGLVVSVPVRSGGHLVGIVAGMIPLENISELLEESGPEEMILIANTRGEVLTCDDLEEENVAWFRAQLQTQGVDGFFKNNRELFELGNYIVSVSDLDIPDDQNWYMAYMYNLETHFGSGIAMIMLTGYGIAGTVIALGLAFNLLCRNLRKRLLAEDALQEAHNILEAKVQERTSDLAEANSNWKESFDSINDAITIHDEDYNITRANKAAEQILGLPLNRIVGQKCYDIYHGLASPPEGCPSCDVLNTGKACVFEAFEPNLNKFIEIKATPRFDEQDQVVGIVHVVQDISERKKAEEEKKQLQDQLRQTQKLEAVGTLAGGIAHDFNNLLAAIVGYADLALEDIPDGTVARSNIEQVLIAGSRAKELVRQILTFSRKAEQKQEPMEVAPIVKEALKMLRASIPTSIEIRRNIEADLSVIMADPTEIHQILMNLCTNASHAMDDDGGVLEVSLTDFDTKSAVVTDYGTLQPGSYVKLTVKDTGCGMGSTITERIFEPFFTTKPVDKGTGMGLSVVHGIVEDHRGVITVQSQLGKGTTFDIYLPRIESPDTHQTQTVQIPRGKGELILVVDDEKPLVDMMTQMLERLGYTVVGKTASMDALEAFSAEPGRFDLVITDYAMPNMTGKELAEALMAVKPDIPVILCTGFSENIDAESAKSMGIKEFLMKPVVRSELAATIRNVLDKKEITV